ncbi:MAG TPA: hypothetical protein G4N98_08385 [Thermoflexia bacterium]|nr:hypothetical protein [Thermoflexia bacterium]
MLTILNILDKHKGTIIFIGGILLGIIIGLVFLGWMIWPVQWENASPGHLRSDFQLYYFQAVAGEYASTHDMEAAREKLGLTLKGKNSNPWISDPATLETTLNKVLSTEGVTTGTAMNLLARDLATREGITLAPEPAAAEETNPDPGESSFMTVVGLLFVVIILAGGSYFLVTRLRGGKPTGEAKLDSHAGAFGHITDEEPGIIAGDIEPPLSSFGATYKLGDDFFDPSFSIEVSEGQDFLGECGVGISESIGAGDPKKVTALEAWLFDKSDIRTVTTVLASDYAYHDDNMNAKLAVKGNVVHIEPGMEVALETTALRVHVYIKDVTYAEGDLPAGSFFQQVSIELRAWVKNEESLDEESLVG